MRRLIAWLVARVLLALGWTLRFRRVGWRRVRQLRARGEPFAFAAWHGRSLVMLPGMRDEGCTALVSLSHDGDHATALLESLGYGVVRGSSSKGGAGGLRGLVRAARRGEIPSVAVDGPRGPAGVVAPGVVGLSQLAGLWVVPLAASCRSGLRLRTWDRTLIPGPGARVLVLAGRPIRVARDGDRLGATRALERRLQSLHRCADRLAGAVE
jgi:lysophospholipid acyltransferase (LPLAT)-like uncharacterized protein